MQGDVLSGEPHTLADPVLRCRFPLFVCLLLHPGHRLLQVGACDPPGPLAPPDERLRRLDSHLQFLTGKQWGLVPETTLERREASSGRNVRVHGILCPRQLCAPGGGVLSAEAPKNRLQ